MIEKIWLVIQESNVDGEILVNVVPCASEEAAMKIVQEEKETLFSDSYFSQALPYYEGSENMDMDECPFEWDESKSGFNINALYDNYYEDISIVEKQIQF